MTKTEIKPRSSFGRKMGKTAKTRAPCSRCKRIQGGVCQRERVNSGWQYEVALLCGACAGNASGWSPAHVVRAGVVPGK